MRRALHFAEGLRFSFPVHYGASATWVPHCGAENRVRGKHHFTRIVSPVHWIENAS